MGYDEVIAAAEEAVKKLAPKGTEVTDVTLEGPVVCLYTKSMEAFASNNELIRQLAQSLRRRVAIRPDPSLLKDKDEAEKQIREIVPSEAQITSIYFDEDSGEVTIEALNPWPAIGKEGAMLNELKKATGWSPKVVRAPPIPSKIVEDVRQYLRSASKERKEFLVRLGKKICRDPRGGEPYVRATMLGGFREVGRSCALLMTNESKVMVECGLAWASEDLILPYLKVPELQPIDQLDAVVITHAHLDHMGLLPALFKYGYDGPVYCTAPTRDMMSLLQLDYIKVAYAEGKKSPYESANIRDLVKRCITLRYGETTDISPDVRLTFQNAGHILGSATAHFHIGDGLYNVAFSGDMKYEKTWLFNAATTKFPRLETIVIESTYGGHHDMQPSRQEAAEKVQGILSGVLERGGRVIVPVFAVGRSQEVMVVLEQFMRLGKIPKVPIYLDGMIYEATAIHTAYPEFLNTQLRTQIFQNGANPFLSEVFKRIDSHEMREQVCDSVDPCIALATSGMMNGGPVLEYLKSWGSDEKSALVFVGFQAEGTMGRRIQRGMREVTLQERGRTVKVDLKLETITCDGFSGHSDRQQLMAYVAALDPRPERVIVGHGEESKCIELASALYKKYGLETRAPANLETIRLR
jgi:hypothetical protein